MVTRETPKRSCVCTTCVPTMRRYEKSEPIGKPDCQALVVRSVRDGRSQIAIPEAVDWIGIDIHAACGRRFLEIHIL